MKRREEKRREEGSRVRLLSSARAHIELSGASRLFLSFWFGTRAPGTKRLHLPFSFLLPDCCGLALVMFSGLLQEHQKKVASERKAIDKNRAEATALAKKLSDTLVDSVNAGVAEVM